MIYTLKGTIIQKELRFVILEVGSIGFKVNVTLATSESLPQEGEQVKLFCFLNVREDGLDLYGFA